MARRIEIELTSARPDGTWTWRAAGAKQPKGVLEGKLLYEGAAVGDVVRAEADFEIEGIFVTSVLPPKAKERKEPERLEIVGPPREHQGVTSSLVPKSDRGRREGRGPRRDGDRPRDGERPRTGDRARTGDRPGGGDRPRTGGDRPGRAEAARAGERRPTRGPRPDGREGPARPARPAREEQPAPPKPKRLTPQHVHRTAVLESLSPEQRPVAEQVLRGGIPAVRQAVEAQNARLRETGQSEVKAEALVGLAEELLPRLKTAEWRDRAEAAAKEADDIALRDLRSVVSGADAAARDDETRLLASTLREALERRVAKQREEWVTEIGRCLDDGRLVRALRVSSRPPDPGTRFPAELSTRLVEAANAALNPDIAPDRWATVLEAVASSPVRRQVKPAGLPAEPGDALLQAARQSAGLVPALAPLLGLDMPPPPPPAGRPRRPAGAGRRVPPPPARPPAARAAAPAGAAAPAAVDAGPPSDPAGEARPASPEPAVVPDPAAALPPVDAPAADAGGHAGPPPNAAAAPAVAPSPAVDEPAADPGEHVSAPPDAAPVTAGAPSPAASEPAAEAAPVTAGDASRGPSEPTADAGDNADAPPDAAAAPSPEPSEPAADATPVTGGAVPPPVGEATAEEPDDPDASARAHEAASATGDPDASSDADSDLPSEPGVPSGSGGHSTAER